MAKFNWHSEVIASFAYSGGFFPGIFVLPGLCCAGIIAERIKKQHGNSMAKWCAFFYTFLVSRPILFKMQTRWIVVSLGLVWRGNSVDVAYSLSISQKKHGKETGDEKNGDLMASMPLRDKQERWLPSRFNFNWPFLYGLNSWKQHPKMTRWNYSCHSINIIVYYTWDSKAPLNPSQSCSALVLK